MLKHLLVCIIILISAYNIYSQHNIGISAGISVSNARYENPDLENLVKKYKHPKAGIYIGFSLPFALNKIMRIEPEINYITVGFRFNQPEYKSKNRYGYLNLSVKGSMQYKIGYDALLSFKIGAYTGYWIWGNYYYQDLRSGRVRTTGINFKSGDWAYNRLDAGLWPAIGYTFILKKVHIELETGFRYSLLSNDKNKIDGQLNRSLITCSRILF